MEIKYKEFAIRPIQDLFDVKVWEPLVEDEITKLKKNLEGYKKARWNEFVHSLFDKGEITNEQWIEWVE